MAEILSAIFFKTKPDGFHRVFNIFKLSSRLFADISKDTAVNIQNVTVYSI